MARVIAQPRLSICIGTLNRAEYLKETLKSILTQTREGLEVVIVDGASTDGTADVVRSFQATYSNVRYTRLDIKGGFDRDYCRAVQEAVGEYCWLFTDDDVLKPGAIDAVWSQLDRQYSLVVVNADVMDADMHRILEARCLPVDGNVVYEPAEFERLFSDTVSFMSFIGCVVIRRDLWLARETAAYIGTYFVHVGVIFQAPLATRSVVIGHPLISIRYGNALWTSKSFEISMFKWPALIWSFPHFSVAAKRCVSPLEPWRTWTALLVYRARGVYGVTDYRRLLRERIASRAARAWALTVARLPACLVNLTLVAYLSSLGRHRSTPELRLLDLRSSTSYYRRCLSRLLAKVWPFTGRFHPSAR